MIISDTAKEIIEALREEYHYSIQQIAEKTNLSAKTLYQILNGKKPHPKTNWQLINYYLKLKLLGQIP